MSLVVSCQCGQSFAARAELAGLTRPCPACGRLLQIPDAPAAAHPSSAPAYPKQTRHAAPQPTTAQQPQVPRPVTALNRPVAAVTGQPSNVAPAQSTPAKPTITRRLNPMLIAVIGGAAGAGLLLLIGVVVVIQFLGDRSPPPGPVANMPQHGFPPAHFGPPPSHHSSFPPTASHPPANWPPSRPNPLPPASSPRPPVTSNTQLPKTVVYTSPGQFSMAAPAGWRWEDLGSKPFAGRPAREFLAKGNAPTGTLLVKIVEMADVANEERQAFVQGRRLQLSNSKNLQGATLASVKGLDHAGTIPNVVNYSYSLQMGSTRSEGRGQIIFGKKRVCLISITSLDRVNDQLIHSCLATFREL